jgi:polysaccharide pyruvyl transferase WcaK-like protein
MRSAGADRATEDRGSGESRDTGDLFAHEGSQEVPVKRSRIALLTPYSGGNLGDAAIQDAIIAGLRLRLADPQFSGLTLNGDNFVERHGTCAFPLYAARRPLYRLHQQSVTGSRPGGSSMEPTSATRPTSLGLRQLLSGAPVLGRCLNAIRSLVERAYGEVIHSVRGYRFLRTHHLLIVSGGGQLDEEWGGPWGHPFALFKWAVLARIARVPYAIASVGACKVTSPTSRFLLSLALRLARYRSYRDKNSRKVAASLLRRASRDPVVPDLAFSLPPSELPPPAGLPSTSWDRPIIAISPIAYAKPGTWAYENSALYERYLQQMARLLAQLFQRGYFLLLVCSSVGDDDRVVPEILERLDDESKQRAAVQMHIPRIRTWKDLVISLRGVDCLIASRLHSTILGFISQKPTVAISFDPKVDWVMEDLGQTEYLLHIQDFTAQEVIETLDRIKLRKDVVVEQIASYRQRILSDSELQYHKLAALALADRRGRA